MADAWSPACSSVREKVLEHVFLADLSKILLRRYGCDFEILRAEVDRGGYDLAIEANGILRHIQLKAMRKGGKRASVGVSTALSRRPGGCVIWMVVDEETFALGPFYWFGGEPGARLPPLGEVAVRHSKANSQGVKTERPAQRLLSRGLFRRINSIRDLADVLFGASVTTSESEALQPRLEGSSSSLRLSR